MRYSCSFIKGHIQKAKLSKVINQNFWYKGETTAVFQTMHPFQIGFGLLKNHFPYVYETFIDFCTDGFGSFYATEADSLKVGKMLYEGFVKDENFIYTKQGQWRADLAILHQKAAVLNSSDLSKLSNIELAKLYEDYLASFYIAWTIPLILEMNAVYVEQVLVPKLRKKLGLEIPEFNQAISTLSAPTQFSYLTLERIDFLKLVLSFSEEALQKHFEKYYWIKSSYRRLGDYSREEIKKLIKGETKKGKKHISIELESLEKLPSEISKKQATVIRQYKVGKEEQKLFLAMAVFGDWQDKRKEMNIFGNHHIFVLLFEIAKRLDLEVDILASAFPSETVDALLGKAKLDERELLERWAFHLHAVNSNLEELFLVGGVARDLKMVLEGKIEERFKEIKGMVASVGGCQR